VDMLHLSLIFGQVRKTKLQEARPRHVGEAIPCVEAKIVDIPALVVHSCVPRHCKISGGKMKHCKTNLYEVYGDIYS